MLIYEYCNGAAYHVQLSQCYAEPPYVRMACVWMVFGIPRYTAMPTCCTCVGCGRAAALPVWSWSTFVACVVKELVENFTDSLFGRVQLLKPDICSFCGRPLCNIQMAASP